MGKDGARTVIVNSVGREMGELERTEPVEGRRLKLTIDYDIQKAIEDGFDAARLQRRRRGARPADRRSARLHEPSGVRSERLRRGHRPRHVGCG